MPEKPKKTYQKPTIQQIGHMALVTKKTGPNLDQQRAMKSGKGGG
jgi:hypothetical protein